MRTSLFLCLLLCVLGATTLHAQQYTPAALADKIAHLPGLANQPSFNHFSGYLEVDPVSHRSIFYWFIESTNNPATDPLIWWSNGGPGCSGLLGLLTEHGPWRPNSKGELEDFDYSWNRLANVLYVEAPAGVGFSYSDNRADYTTNDQKTAQDNYVAIQQFFQRFPHLLQNDLYVSAESYGGHYVPQLTQLILHGKDKREHQWNFKGFLLGNPIADMDENMYYGAGQTMCGHSLASKPTCDRFAQECLGATPSPQCERAQAQVLRETGDIDPYGLDFPTCTAQEKRVFLRGIYSNRKSLLRSGAGSRFVASLSEPSYDPCLMAEETTYLNRPDVRVALHTSGKVNRWDGCSNTVRYNMTQLYDRMQPLYEEFVARPDIRDLKLVIFSGDNDSVCATLGTQWWMYALWKNSVVKPWTPWSYTSEKYGKQIAGFEVRFKGITLVTVQGSGHMVSTYTPEKGFYVLKHFLEGKFTNDFQKEQQDVQIASQ